MTKTGHLLTLLTTDWQPLDLLLDKCGLTRKGIQICRQRLNGFGIATDVIWQSGLPHWVICINAYSVEGAKKALRDRPVELFGREYVPVDERRDLVV